MLAALYFVALVRHPPQWPGLRVAGFFTESTCLFPRANVASTDYRPDAWSCTDRRWTPIDPRAYPVRWFALLMIVVLVAGYLPLTDRGRDRRRGDRGDRSAPC